ncbi:MAG TPA: proton-conducting transporter membrane subunit, partial [Bacillota bacterium]|nr:proton-conducting transporter membrane subunit [Bacillota bacterium]
MALSFSIGILLFAAGAIVSIVFRRSPRFSLYLVHLMTGLGSLAWLVSAIDVLLGHPLRWSVLGQPLPFMKWSLSLDGLAAFFMLILAVVTLFISFFAPGYLRSYLHRKNLWSLLMGLNLFVLSMGLVITAGDGWSFLFFWEAMALTSFFLVMFEHEEKKNRLAGFIYLIMTHVGTVFIIALLLILRRQTGSLDFSVMKMHAAQIPANLRNLIFLFAMIGFGTKAGMAPLHIWLPRAHPAAPSHISALMSGVMVKTAIYAFVRLSFDILGGGPAWWGLLIVLIGLVTSLLGVLYALVEQNLKKMLAYSSVENIGIILLALGAALYLRAAGKEFLSLLALSAAFIHTMNHALFKSLLFLGVGAVQQQTHTRNVEKLGGLIRGMPWTAAFFLIGSLAISAMPFTNGFIGEWRTLQGLLSMGSVPSDPLLRMVGPVAASGLALTGGLA